MTNPYRVPKRAVVADVLLTAGGPMQLRFFLSEVAETHDGPERPSDFLGRSNRFLPAYDPSDESVMILRRDAILVLTVSEAEERPADEEAGMPGPAEAPGGMVEAVLSTGASLHGELRYQMPEGQQRLQDFLNTTDPFLMLLSDGKVRFVNKAHVVRIRMVG